MGPLSTKPLVVVVVAKASASKVYTRVTLASTSVGCKDLEGWTRTSKDVLSGCIEPGADALAAVSASSLPGIPLCPGIHRRFVGPGQAFRWDLRWWVAGNRRSIAMRSDWLSVQIVSEYSGWLVVAHSIATCMAAASSANDEVNPTPRR